MLTQDMREQIAADNVTLKNGYWFVFQAGDDEVAINASAWSGMERYYINGELVTKKLNLFKRNKAFKFSHGENTFDIRIKITNFLTSEWECTALKNGQIFGIASATYYEGTVAQMFKKFLPLFLIGSALGGVGTYIALYLFATSPELFRHFIVGGITGVFSVLLLPLFLRRK